MTNVLTRELAKEAVAKLQAEGKKVVFTNGCFDILHVGHVRYLQHARTLGDALIIGVNSDESVRKLKGPNRPINNEDDRAEILAALRCVDYTVLFGEQTPEALISELKPDVHVKAGDYTEDQLPEAKVVRSYGGDVVIAPFVAGKSTTKTIAKINESASN